MTKKQAMPYMKLYISYLDDVRLNRLPVTVRWRYLQIYILAFKADAAGELLDPETGEPLSAADLAMLLRDAESVVIANLAALVSAELLEQDGAAWRVTRYTAEQVDQAEYRRETAERVAKHRNRQSQENQRQSNQSQLNPSQFNIEEINNNNKSISQSISQVKSSKVKSNTAVTRYTRVTDGNGQIDRSTDGLTDAIIIINPSTALHPAVIPLAKFWLELTGERVIPYTQRLINKALNEGIAPQAIEDKIQAMENNHPLNKDAYFTECLKELYTKQPTRAQVVTAINDHSISDSAELNRVLQEDYNLNPITPEQLLEWGLAREPGGADPD